MLQYTNLPLEEAAKNKYGGGGGTLPIPSATAQNA